MCLFKEKLKERKGRGRDSRKERKGRKRRKGGKVLECVYIRKKMKEEGKERGRE